MPKNMELVALLLKLLADHAHENNNGWCTIRVNEDGSVRMTVHADVLEQASVALTTPMLQGLAHAS